MVYISSSFLLNNDNNNYLDMGKTRIQAVYSMFSGLLLITESDNKRPEVQLTTELACKLICHRKCWSNSQWQVTRNVCFRLALNLLITCLHAVIHTAKHNVLQYIHIHINNLRPKTFLRPHTVCASH